MDLIPLVSKTLSRSPNLINLAISFIYDKICNKQFINGNVVFTVYESLEVKRNNSLVYGLKIIVRITEQNCFTKVVVYDVFKQFTITRWYIYRKILLNQTKNLTNVWQEERTTKSS